MFLLIRTNFMSLLAAGYPGKRLRYCVLLKVKNLQNDQNI